MRIDLEKVKTVEIRNDLGRIVPNVVSYNTVTRETEFWVKSPSNSKGMIVRAVLVGCKAFNKKTGQEVKTKEDLWERSQAV